MPSCLRENTAETRGGVRGRLPTKDEGPNNSLSLLRRQLPRRGSQNERTRRWRCTSSGRTASTFPSKGKTLCKPPTPAEKGKGRTTPSVSRADSSLEEGANRWVYIIQPPHTKKSGDPALLYAIIFCRLIQARPCRPDARARARLIRPSLYSACRRCPRSPDNSW